MEEVRKYIAYLIQWLSGHGDLELDALTEFEVIRVIMDAYECYSKEWSQEKQKGK